MIRLHALEDHDTAHLTKVRTLIGESNDHDRFIKSMRPGGKCLRCPERKYLICSLSDDYCKNTITRCRKERRNENRYLIGNTQEVIA